jgi:hypothetical protein
MISKKDQYLYESVEYNIRKSIPYMAKNIQQNLKEWSFAEKIGLFGKEVHNRVLDAAHRLNWSVNFDAKKNARRIRDELLTAHYSREFGKSPKNIRNILALPAGSNERIAFEAKLKALGARNPLIGSLQKDADTTIKRYSDRINKSMAVLRSKRSPQKLADLYRFARKNPGLKNIVP